MTNNLKQLFFWLATFSLYVGVGVAARQQSDWFNGVSGYFLYFFLAYCSVIVAAQGLVLWGRFVYAPAQSSTPEKVLDETELDLETNPS